MPKKILSRDDRTTYREGSFLLFVIKLIHFLGFFFWRQRFLIKYLSVNYFGDYSLFKIGDFEKNLLQ